MKEITRKKFTKRMAQYGALTAAIAGVSDMSGQVIYTDIDPDETITASSYMLDLDGDAVVDLTITARTNPLAVRAYTDQGTSIRGINTGGNFNYPFVLSSGDPISSGQTDFLYSPTNQTLNWNSCSYTSSQWCGGIIDGYLGLRFNIGGATHYGWARMDLAADGSSFTIKDYAYNSTPDEGLEAGQQTLGIEDQIFEGFTHFVNSDGLNLEARTPMTNVEVYDIIGKKVITQNLQSNREVIGLSGLNTGVYIATVTVEGQTKSFKIVKK